MGAGHGDAIYRFAAHALDRARWVREAGIYIFAAPSAYADGPPVALLVAASDDFSCDLPGHAQLATVRALGANEVHIRVLNDPSARACELADLISVHSPPCNSSDD